MPVFATLIFLIACFDPGNCDKITRSIVRNILDMIAKRDDAGLTNVAMLGNIGVFKDFDDILERYMSVRIY
jgi:hypothetical protein